MRWLLCASVLALMSGCHTYTLDMEGRIAERAGQPIDAPPASVEKLPMPLKATFGTPTTEANVIQAANLKEPDKDKKAPSGMWENLTRYTKEIPGGNVEEFKAPARVTPVEACVFGVIIHVQNLREAAIKKQLPPLPALPRLAAAGLSPDGRPYTLTELQQIALRTNPLIRQAHRDIDAARGIALQQGLYPNPTIGYESDSINQGRTSGQQGGYINQLIKTAGKLSLARAAGLADVDISEQKLRQAEAELQTQVRKDYFALLSAEKNFATTKSLAQLTDELYNVLFLQLIVGEVAAYEPVQIRVLANQARGALILAQNRYLSAWRQLATTLGTPTLPLTAVVGQIDMPVPRFEHDRVLAYVLANHTDVLSAQVAVDKHRLLLRLAEVQVYPDINVNLVVQKDYTTAPFGTTANISAGIQFPLWDRNQGNIQAARSLLGRAIDENQNVQNNLTRKVADAFERYDNNRALLKLYKDQILPNQVQAYRAAVARHAAVLGKDAVSYNDLVTSEQTLASLVTSYLGALSDQWTAVVDIANLLQTRDLFQTQSLEEVAPIPDVQEIIGGDLLHRRR